ncbi:MAG: isoleucine--tRNA ligase, partial [Hyphomicrobiales bacterium]|nr:isoleucine--tRNA ligase [Hyphomicrobiales bacterium]
DVLAAAKSGEWRRLDGEAVEVAGQVLEPDAFELRFRAAEGLDAASFDGSAGVIVLDTEVDAALQQEGLARDFIRLVQVARKDAGFNVADRIQIEVKAGTAADAAIAAHLDTVKRETLAISYDSVDTPAGFLSQANLADEPIAIGVRVAG